MPADRINIVQALQWMEQICSCICNTNYVDAEIAKKVERTTLILRNEF